MAQARWTTGTRQRASALGQELRHRRTGQDPPGCPLPWRAPSFQCQVCFGSLANGAQGTAPGKIFRFGRGLKRGMRQAGRSWPAGPTLAAVRRHVGWRAGSRHVWRAGRSRGFGGRPRGRLRTSIEPVPFGSSSCRTRFQNETARAGDWVRMSKEIRDAQGSATLPFPEN